MDRSKLALLLRRFDGTDKRLFRKFLQSPFFNEQDILLKLYDFFIQNAASLPDKEKIWRAIFQKTEFNDQEFRHLASQLHQLALTYLTWRSMQRDALGKQLYQLSSLDHPELQKHFQGVVRGFHRASLQPGIQDTNFHNRLSRLELFQHQQLEKSGRRVRTFSHLEASDYQLDCYYITQKLKNYCELLGYQKTIATEGRIRLFPGFIKYVEGSEYLEEPLVKAYYLTSRMLSEPEQEQYFRELRDLLMHQGQIFHLREKQTLFVHLINYCIDLKINIGRQDYFQELFKLYKIALDQRIIFNGKELDPQHYKNIITIGLYIREYKWSEGFIQEYTADLPDAHQENALNYNLAKVYFQQGAYPKVIEQLREVEYQNVTYALGSKLMLLKTYYEMGEYRALDSLAESFRIYLRRNKLISKDLRQQYLNVIRFTRRLSSVAPFDKKAIEKIRKQIEGSSALADKAWILKKLEEVGSGGGPG